MATTDRLAVCAVLGIALAATAVAAWRQDLASSTPRADTGSAFSYAMRMEDVRTTVVRDGRRQVTVAAERVRVGAAKLAGPFRIGFLPAITASGVTVDLADGGAIDAAAIDHLMRRLSPTGAREPRISLPIDIEGLQVASSERGTQQLVLAAERCSSTILAPVLRCHRGQLRVGKAWQHFGDGPLSRGRWRSGAPGATAEIARIAASGRR